MLHRLLQLYIPKVTKTTPVLYTKIYKDYFSFIYQKLQGLHQSYIPKVTKTTTALYTRSYKDYSNFANSAVHMSHHPCMTDSKTQQRNRLVRISWPTLYKELVSQLNHASFVGSDYFNVMVSIYMKTNRDKNNISVSGDICTT